MTSGLSKIPISYSRLSTFEQCGLKFEYLYITKQVVDLGSEATNYGTRVHTALEVYGKELAIGDKQSATDKALAGTNGEAVLWFPLVDKIHAQQGDKYYEHKMSITADKKPCDWFASDVWLRSIADVLIVNGTQATILDWKGLPLDTQIPTPNGLVTMENLAVDDEVFSSQGIPCKVIGKSTVHNEPCYEILFSDKTKITCDENHLWPLLNGTVLKTTQVLRGDKMPIAKCTRTDNISLPIPPYIVGMWLANGKHSSSEITSPDHFVWEKIHALGYELGSDTGNGCTTRTIKGIRKQLIQLGLLRCGKEKFIPSLYLRSGTSQRLELLKGLMDGDGNANPFRKHAVYTTTCKRLSDDVKELASSLGQRVSQATTKQFGFGVHCIAYPLSFRPQGINPFSLPRKADRICASWGTGLSAYRTVLSVTQVSQVPTQCIEVDSADKTYLCTKDYMVTHNSGKVRDNPSQMQIFAMMVMLHFPQVNTVKTSFVWLVYNKITNITFTRRMLDGLWLALSPRFDALQDAVDVGAFKAKPSGLCPYCPAKDICPSKR